MTPMEVKYRLSVCWWDPTVYHAKGMRPLRFEPRVDFEDREVALAEARRFHAAGAWSVQVDTVEGEFITEVIYADGNDENVSR